MKYVATVNDESRVVEIETDGRRHRVRVGDGAWDVDARLTAPGVCSLLIDGASYTVGVVDRDGAYLVDVDGESYEVAVEEQTRHIIRTSGGSAGGARRSRTLTAPLPGKISRVAVRPGDSVQAGDTLLVIEAMKMENEFKASGAGTVAEVRVAAGQAVNAGDVLIVMG